MVNQFLLHFSGFHTFTIVYMGKFYIKKIFFDEMKQSIFMQKKKKIGFIITIIYVAQFFARYEINDQKVCG